MPAVSRTRTRIYARKYLRRASSNRRRIIFTHIGASHRRAAHQHASPQHQRISWRTRIIFARAASINNNQNGINGVMFWRVSGIGHHGMASSKWHRKYQMSSMAHHRKAEENNENENNRASRQ